MRINSNEECQLATSCSNRGSERQGTVTLEAAVILPVMIFLIIGAIDIGQFINLAQVVSNASHEGARIASRAETESSTDVESSVQGYFLDSFSNVDEQKIKSAIKVEVFDDQGNKVVGESLAAIPSGEQLTINVEFDFSKIRWMRGLEIWNNQPKVSATVFRRE